MSAIAAAVNRGNELALRGYASDGAVQALAPSKGMRLRARTDASAALNDLFGDLARPSQHRPWSEPVEAELLDRPPAPGRPAGQEENPGLSAAPSLLQPAVATQPDGEPAVMASRLGREEMVSADRNLTGDPSGSDPYNDFALAGHLAGYLPRPSGGLVNLLA